MANHIKYFPKNNYYDSSVTKHGRIYYEGQLLMCIFTALSFAFIILLHRS